MDDDTDRPRMTRPSDNPEEARRVGAAFGTAGVSGAFAYMNRKHTKHAIGSVSPASGRGFLLAALWCIGFAAVFAIGRAMVPALANVWGLITLGVMVTVLWRLRCAAAQQAKMVRWIIGAHPNLRPRWTRQRSRTSPTNCPQFAPSSAS